MTKMTLPMVASLVYSDRKKGINNYKLINKYVGPLPKEIILMKGDK